VPLILALFIGASTLGCRPIIEQNKPIGYFGPTESITEVIAAVNANNEQLKTLAASGSFELWFKQDNKTEYVNGTLKMAYAFPQSLRMFGDKDLAGRIFEIGSNDERYWFTVYKGESTMWTGAYANINSVDPRRIPIRPDLVLEVLGIQPIPTNLLQSPVPVLRFNNDADAYMIVWSLKLQDRWIAQKEVWYDRKTKLPKLVNLFDEDGRIVVRAYLINHEPVEILGTPRDRWPRVATSYRLLFPYNGSSMSIDLSRDNIALTRNGAPNPRSFTFPAENAGVSRAIQLDEKTAP